MEITLYVLVDDHINAWKKACEKTTVGPSGLHFGMFKAQADDPELAEIDAILRNIAGMFKAQADDPELAEIDAILRNIAYCTGFVFPRWCQGVDVQILKWSHDFRIEKLRTILLLEADFNMNNKQLGRDLMWKAEQDNSLAANNYGVWKKKCAVEVSLNITLTYNSIWARRSKAMLLSNNACGCFDRIAHMVAYICLLRLRAPKEPLLSRIGTIQCLRHFIRTAFGVSEKTDGGDTEISLQGLLQGNGMAPPGWTAVSAV